MATPAIVPLSTYAIPNRKDNASRVPVNMLNQQHPEHKLYEEAWVSIDLLHASGIRLKNQADRFLVKRPKELFDVYQERIRRFTYEGILGTAIGWYISAMFRKDPTIDQPDTRDEFYNEFLQDCDGGKTTYIDLWREVFRQLTLNRTSYVLIDLPSADDLKVIPITRGDEVKAGLTSPLLTCFDARQVINWSMDKRGNLNWILIRTDQQDQEFLGDAINNTIWYYFDRQEYRVYQHKSRQSVRADQSFVLYNPSGDRMDSSPMAELIDRGPHALSKFNRVPIRRIEIPEALWLANRAYLQILTHANKENEYYWALMMGCLAMPVVIGQQDLTNVVLSEAGFIHLQDPTARFEWTEPKGAVYGHMQQCIDTLRQEIFRVMYLQAQARDSSATAQGASGFSKEMDMVPSSDALNGFGKIVRQGMQNVMDDVSAAREGNEDMKWDVNGFRFETKPATQSIALCDEYTGLQIPSDSALKEVQKRTVRDVLDGYNEETIDKACKEVDAAPTQSELKQQQQDQQKQLFQAKMAGAAGAPGQSGGPEVAQAQSKFQTLDARATAKEELSSLS